MGVLTAEEIIREGVQLAGVTYDATDTRPFGWLKDWLRSVSYGWPWPDITGVVEVPLLAGTAGAAFGGSATILNGANIIRITFPLRLYFGSGFLEREITQQAYTSQDINILHLREGVPDKASYIRNFFNGVGTVAIFFNRKTKADYTVQVPYQFDPAAAYVILNVATIIPWYQNDNTMKQAIAHKAAYYNDGPDAKTTGSIGSDLATMLRDDKLKFGVIGPFDTSVNRNWKPR